MLTKESTMGLVKWVLNMGVLLLRISKIEYRWMLPKQSGKGDIQMDVWG